MLTTLKLLYILVGACPLAYLLFVVLTTPSNQGTVLGFLVCAALFTVPPALGYLLLFKLLAPRWIRLRKA